MRLITRSDASLAVALIAATVVIFQQPLRWAFDLAHEMQDRYHVDLIPALTILICVFVLHQSRKRQQAKADAGAAAAEAAQARLRSAELQRLMTFGEALANALDRQALQQALWRHLPAFVQEHECWMLVRTGSRWDSFLLDSGRSSVESLQEIEAMADRAHAHEQPSSGRHEGFIDGTTLCFPLLAGGAAVGVFGIRDGGSFTLADRRVLGAAAAVVAIAVRNVQLLTSTQEASLRDGLTGCYTRAHGIDSIARALRLARRTGRPLSVVMFDIDHFKRINDELGHLRGDDLLRSVGEILRRALRSSDVACRYGGDEFLVVCPDTPLLGAQQVAECLRREITALTVGNRDATRPVSGSFGVASSLADETESSALIERADAAMYQAKRTGRNRFRVANATPASPLSTLPAQTSLAG
jgi:diguanylate cyclase (GGDEF)-like protein